jgi:hypothetical protein
LNRPVKIIIHENSLVARIAAHKLKEKKVAVTIGKRIFLYGVSKENFLNDQSWLCHELAHTAQCQRFGVLRFLFLYFWESLKNGYYNNKFEIEARAKEADTTLLSEYAIS